MIKINKKIRIFGVVLLLSCVVSCAKIPFSHKNSLSPIKRVKLSKNPRLAFVLGGGGAKGLAHLGALYELQQAGITPDLIVGCSAGAIVGAMYASNDNLEQLSKNLLNSNRDHVIGLDVRTYSFYSNDKFSKFLNSHIKAKNFSDLKIPLVVVATSLEFGDLVPFSVGPVVPAVMASSAVPGVFHPVKIDEDYYIDGGVVSSVPVDVAKKFNPDIIVAININEKLAKTEPTNMLGLLKRTLEISYAKHGEYESKQADLVIAFDFDNVGSFTDSQNEFLYNSGREAAKKAIPEIQKLLAKNIHKKESK